MKLKLLLSYLLFVIILALPPLILQVAQNSRLLTPHFWLVFFFFSVLTLMVMAAITGAQGVNGELGAQVYLGATVFKILAFLSFTVVFLLKNRVNKYVFAGDFFYIYFSNTIFEIYGLLRNLRNQK